MSVATDQADAPRESERLDNDRLTAWLTEHLPGGLAGPLEVRQFRKGHSNLTYLLSDGQQEWVLRRPPFGSTVKSAHDMGRENRILRGLHRAYGPAPRALAFCDDEAVLGCEFYVMQRVEGVILRRTLPAGAVLDSDTMAGLSESFVANLVAIHGVDLEQAGLADFGRPAGYTERQVSGWTKRYHGSQTDDIDGVEEVTGWLAASIPDDDEGCLIHNDYKFDNLVLAPDDLTRIIGVLDWEMATVGHPLMDLGTALALWVEGGDRAELRVMQFGPTHLPGAMTRTQLTARYAELSGRDVGRIAFYHAFGLFKMAVVAQQIYYRFATGKTDDPRFAMMLEGAKVLVAEARKQIEETA